MTSAQARTFLRAEWRSLAILTFEAEASLLRPFVPAGTELDQHDGRSLVSLVGFRFLKTSILGCRVPFHEAFDEVNLRIYVRREQLGVLRLGVSFIREVVSRRLVAYLARVAYNEPYVVRRMRSEIPTGAQVTPFRVQYAWRGERGWDSMALTAVGSPLMPRAQSLESFVTARAWGYSRQADGSTLEYHVEHAPWRLWVGREPEVRGDMGNAFGTNVGGALSTLPACVVLAEGSEVTVSRPSPISVRAPTAQVRGAA